MHLVRVAVLIQKIGLSSQRWRAARRRGFICLVEGVVLFARLALSGTSLNIWVESLGHGERRYGESYGVRTMTNRLFRLLAVIARYHTIIPSSRCSAMSSSNRASASLTGMSTQSGRFASSYSIS